MLSTDFIARGNRRLLRFTARARRQGGRIDACLDGFTAALAATAFCLVLAPALAGAFLGSPQ